MKLEDDLLAVPTITIETPAPSINCPPVECPTSICQLQDQEKQTVMALYLLLAMLVTAKLVLKHTGLYSDTDTKQRNALLWVPFVLYEYYLGMKAVIDPNDDNMRYLTFAIFASLMTLPWISLERSRLEAAQNNSVLENSITPDAETPVAGAPILHQLDAERARVILTPPTSESYIGEQELISFEPETVESTRDHAKNRLNG